MICETMGTNIPNPRERGMPYSLPGKIPEASTAPQAESKELQHCCSRRNQYQASFPSRECSVPAGVECAKSTTACSGPSLTSGCEGNRLITPGDCDNEGHWGLENENVSTSLLFIYFLKTEVEKI